MAIQPPQVPSTVGSVLKRAVHALREAGVESPRLTAELLVAHVLGWDRVRVLSHGEVPVDARTADAVAELVGHCCGCVPLQHLTGSQEFYGLAFEVGPAVLIPRPETEILVEKATQLAHSVAPGPVVFADVGTGSGCIAVCVAHALPAARGWAVDISSAALAFARRNAARHGVAERVAFARADLLESFPTRPVFDLVLSNPPYVARRDAENLPRMVRDQEPHVALFGGETGLEVYERLVPQAAPRLKPGGSLVLEIGAGMLGAVSRLLQGAAFSVEEVVNDLQAIPRCIVARRQHGQDTGGRR